MHDDSHAPSEPHTWLDRHGDALYRYALMRVREPAMAEDLVQDTLLSALRGHSRFAGESSERTWLIAILKNKIIDHFRRSTHETPLPESDDPDALIDALFETSSDHWLNFPNTWQNPDTALENSRFWQVFADCLQGLPARQAQAFAMTELEGLDTENLCKALNISTSNVWVLLHRARLRLRQCLEQRWFDAGRESR